MNYKQTKLFSEFQCVGGGCINNCCHDWAIIWSKEGVDKLRTSSGCSDELKKIIESSFEPTENDRFVIKLRENGICPFQGDDGLCIIQKELGEGYLSDDCTAFPRKYYAARQTVYCGCVLACPAVLQKLFDEENAAVLLSTSEKSDIRDVIYSAANRPGLLKAHPELKYHKELLEFFYELIADKRFSAEINIVRGALAAEKLTEAAVDGGKRIAGMIDDLREALEEDDVIQVIQSVQPEYNAKLQMLTVYTEKVFGTVLADRFKNGSGQADKDAFAFAYEKVNDVFKDRSFWFRNVVLNLLVELAVPFRNANKTIYDNYSEFAVIAAVIKMTVMAAVMSENLSIEVGNGSTYEFYGTDCISGLCSVVIRQIMQSKGAVDTLFMEFNLGRVTPRDIAMLIK